MQTTPKPKKVSVAFRLSQEARAMMLELAAQERRSQTQIVELAVEAMHQMMVKSPSN